MFKNMFNATQKQVYPTADWWKGADSGLKNLDKIVSSKGTHKIEERMNLGRRGHRCQSF